MLPAPAKSSETRAIILRNAEHLQVWPDHVSLSSLTGNRQACNLSRSPLVDPGADLYIGEESSVAGDSLLFLLA